MNTDAMHKPAYDTLIVTFAEPKTVVDTFFEDCRTWGVSTLKAWIDNYESTRFTWADDRTAVITSEYNMEHVRAWLMQNMRVERITAE
ncbi:MAG: hypothetical protein NC250_09515 [Alistipes senegalensis]|nr:hypothetical protein [Bacteroides cellulosilyticus]MCM1352950.1 hypothetical protein [Alistipes senegalensis]